jgi:aldose sugar dehydrogenase
MASRRGIAILALTVAVIAAAVFSIYLFLGSRPPSSFGLHTILSGLSWPTAMAFAPDGRIFITERFTGRILIYENGALRASPLYTLTGTQGGLEQGLVGLTLDPSFSTSPWVYAYQTYCGTPTNCTGNATYNRIVRFSANGDVGQNLTVVFAPIPAAGTHNGGIIAFGPDGKLYATDGDAEVPAAAQDLAVLNGKTMRFNADGSVPADNPFVGIAGDDPHIFTYGHRNVFGLAFHPVTHAAFITENGPASDDEINILVPGGNYGWPNVMGFAYTPPYIDPIKTYTPTIAPTNIAVFGNQSFPDLFGDLIFGDYNTHSLRHIHLSPPTYNSVAGESVILTAPDPIIDVKTRPDGSIWFTTTTTLYEYIPAPSVGGAMVTASSPLSSARSLSAGEFALAVWRETAGIVDLPLR